MGQEKTNTMDFAEAIDNSDLEAFGFTDDFIFELWGAITDAKAGRLRKGNWSKKKTWTEQNIKEEPNCIQQLWNDSASHILPTTNY